MALVETKGIYSLKLLITGTSGLLGSALAKEAGGRGIETVALSKDDLDITKAQEVLGLISESRPDVVFNCAAFSNVDRSETEVEEALLVNRDGARNVALAARAVGARMVHLSTDYVFDGQKETPYLPSDQPAPINLYGISKLAGEAAVKEVGGDWLLVRTSWLFGEGKEGFVGLVQKALTEEGEPLRVVNDQKSRPTWTGDLAPALLDLASGGAQGCFHLANAGSCSRLYLALEIRKILEAGRPILPLPSEEYDAPARRPRYSVLDLTETERTLGRSLPHWKDSLRTFLLGREMKVSV
jgi:dTDP-4-dehydrorhamnose reductase